MVISLSRIETPKIPINEELLKFCRRVYCADASKQCVVKAWWLRITLRSRSTVITVRRVTALLLKFTLTQPTTHTVLHGHSSFEIPIQMRQPFYIEARRSIPRIHPSWWVLGRKRLAPGMWGVDLGACLVVGPVVVKRFCLFTIVDNGMMADSLMETGQIKHHMVDNGFKFEPDRRTWLDYLWHGWETCTCCSQ